MITTGPRARQRDLPRGDLPRAALALRERLARSSPLLPESLVARLWRAKGDHRFRTLDDRDLRVAYPGRPAPGHGPDFRDALVELDGRRLRGHIEVHRQPSEWEAHGHQHDRAYDAVILHVVGRSSAAPRGAAGHLPTVIVNDEAAGGDGGHALDLPPLSGLRGAGSGRLREQLHRAGLARFDHRAALAKKAVSERGADETLYRALMEGLGYAENRAPFMELADHLPLCVLRAVFRTGARGGHGAGLMRELLLSASGLAQPTASWWELIGAPPMERGVWRTTGVRPANHPRRRVEAAAALLERHLTHGLVRSLAEAARTGPPGLVRALTVAGLPGGAPSGGCALIGAGRARELCVSAVLPTLAAWQTLGGGGTTGVDYRGIYAGFPALPDNTLTREARRLLGAGPASGGRLGACARSRGCSTFTGEPYRVSASA